MKFFLFIVLFGFTSFAYSYNTYNLADRFSDVDFAENENIPTWGVGNHLGEGAVISYNFAESAYFAAPDYSCGGHIVGDSCVSVSTFMPEGYQGVISSAFDVWEEAANLSFTQVVGQTGDVIVGGGALVGSNTLGYGGFNVSYDSSVPSFSSISSGFLDFDRDIDWSDSDILFGVALHEIGHVLGLKHSDDSNSMMYYLYSSDTNSLQPDDIAGIQYLYGAPVSAVPEPSTYLLFLLGLAMVVGYGRKAKAN